MAEYQAPLRDMSFVLNEVFQAPTLWNQLPELAENVDPDTANAVLEEAGKINAEVIGITASYAPHKALLMPTATMQMAVGSV